MLPVHTHFITCSHIYLFTRIACSNTFTYMTFVYVFTYCIASSYVLTCVCVYSLSHDHIAVLHLHTYCIALHIYLPTCIARSSLSTSLYCIFICNDTHLCLLCIACPNCCIAFHKYCIAYSHIPIQICCIASSHIPVLHLHIHLYCIAYSHVPIAYTGKSESAMIYCIASSHSKTYLLT